MILYSKQLIPARLQALSTYCVITVLLSAVIVVSGCRKKEAAKPPAAPAEVLVTEVVQKDIPVIREWVGVLDGSVNADIRARVNGTILSRNYKEGGLVNKGDLLFQVDPRPFEAAVAQAKANLGKAQSAQLKTELDAKRNADLFAKKLLSTEDYDNTVQANTAAKAEVLAVQAALQTAALDLQYTKVEAPITGVAGQANTEEGDLVGPNTGVLTTISTVDPMKAYISFTEQEYLESADKIRNDESTSNTEPTLELILSDGTVYPEKGKFDFADRQVDARTGTIRIGTLFPNPDNRLKPGQFARLRARVSVLHNSMVVPQRAVKELQGSYQVAKITTDSKVALRTVKATERYGSLWAIQGDVSPGDRVIVEGLQKAKEGVQVVTKPWIPATNAGTSSTAAVATSGATDIQVKQGK